MLELYIPRKYYRHEKVAQNVNHLNISMPNLNGKYIPEILDWQNNSTHINDQFHLTNHDTAKKLIYHHKNTIQTANNETSPKIKNSYVNKKNQPSKDDIIGGKKEIFNHICLLFSNTILLFDCILIS